MAIKISSTDVIDNSRQIVNATGGVFTSGAGIVTATSYRGDGSQLTGITASAFDAGTLMLFQQSAAPTGWTKQTTHNNKALRVVSGAAGSGGSTAFTSVFTSRTPAGTVTMTNAAVTLTESQIPSHSHGVPTYQGAKGGNGSAGAVYNSSGLGPGSGSFGTDGTGGGASHTHSNTASFSGTALDFAVQYVDLIIASKN